MKFTVDVVEQGYLDGLSYARKQYNAVRLLAQQIDNDQDYFAMLAMAWFASYAHQMGDAAVSEALAAAKAGDESKLQSVASAVAGKAPMPMPEK